MRIKSVFTVAALLFLPLLAMACGPYGPGGGWEYGHMMNYGFGYGGMFMWIIFLIILGVAIYFIVKALNAKDISTQGQDTPLNILKMRYAKGEITQEEFERMKKDLE